MTLEFWNYIDICTDCMVTVEYGAHLIAPEDADKHNPAGWYVGEADRPIQTEPLGLVRDFTIFNVGDDDAHFSMRACDGCGSRLGGDRHRASLHRETT